jgi:hypothetical protein
MKSKGQVAFYAISLSMVLIVLVLALAPAGKVFIDSAMNASTADFIGLDCDNTSISSYTHATCIITDFSLAYFFGGLLLIALGVLGAKIYLSGGTN